MASWLIAVVGFIYFFVATDLWSQNKPALALTFFAYALSNVGLFFAAS